MPSAVSVSRAFSFETTPLAVAASIALRIFSFRCSFVTEDSPVKPTGNPGLWQKCATSPFQAVMPHSSSKDLRRAMRGFGRETCAFLRNQRVCPTSAYGCWSWDSVRDLRSKGLQVSASRVQPVKIQLRHCPGASGFARMEGGFATQQPRMSQFVAGAGVALTVCESLISSTMFLWMRHTI